MDQRVKSNLKKILLMPLFAFPKQDGPALSETRDAAQGLTVDAYF